MVNEVQAKLACDSNHLEGTQEYLEEILGVLPHLSPEDWSKIWRIEWG